MHFLVITSALLAVVSGVFANLAIHNWCPEDILVYQSNPDINDNCDTGSTGSCFTDPWTISEGQVSTLPLPWINSGKGTSVKIARGTFANDVLQYEYTMTSNGLYWDLSNLDGQGDGLVGTPFAHDNVEVIPTGPGVDQGTCRTISCPADEVCLDAYQDPYDTATRFCPANTGTMWIDLCKPQDNSVKRRGVHFVS